MAVYKIVSECARLTHMDEMQVNKEIKKKHLCANYDTYSVIFWGVGRGVGDCEM